MTLASGIIPYDYERYPWRASAGENLGFSGVVFEQAMWVITAELRRYSTTADDFLISGILWQNYQHSSGIPGYGDYLEMGRARSSYGFEPTTSGAYLVNDQVNTTDWIQDMRLALSGFLTWSTITQNYTNAVNGLFQLVGNDSDATNFGWDWLKAKVGYIGFQYPYYNIQYNAPPNGTLGASGNLYDTDLDEVLYHPIPRFAQKADINGGTPVTIDIGRPIFPAFAKPDGNLVSMTSTDNNIAFSDDFHYAHVSSGLVRIDGDVLLDSNTYDFGGNNATFTVQGIRRFGSFTPAHLDAYIPVTRVYVDPPAGTENIVIPIISNTGIFPPSGEQSSRFPATDGLAGVSGFEYITDALWVNTNGFSNGGQDYSAFIMYSPHSRQRLWAKFAEDGEMLELGGLLASPKDIHRQDSSNIISFSGLYQEPTFPTDSNRAIFAKYNNNMARTSVFFAESLIAGGSIGEDYGVRFWHDGTDVFLYTRQAVTAGGITFPIIESWPLSNFATRTAYSSGTFDENSEVEPDNFFASDPPVVGFKDLTTGLSFVSAANSGVNPTGFNQITFTGSTFDLGPLEVILGNNVGFGSTKFYPRRVEVIDSATDFTPGVWCFLERVSGGSPKDYYLARIERDSGKWQIQELYAQKNTVLYTGATSLRRYILYFII